MPNPIHPAGRGHEQGGITIVVTLMLLVLLTITALGLSRNTFRQAVAAGTVRQANMVQNLADAGLEYSIFWVGPDPGNRPTPTGGALLLNNTRVTAKTDGSQGLPQPTVSHADMTLYSDANTTQRFDVTVTYMGTVIPDNNQVLTQRSSTTAPTATDLDLWGVMANGYLTYAGGVTFVHRRESWFTAPQSTLP
jgi:Tfp pilus assembly protein PilX